MPSLINQAQSKKNYDFVEAIRCISMIFIVAEHSVATGGYGYHYGDDLYWPYLILMQLAKFGSITFFLLSGFLIGDKFADYSPGQYLKRRLSSTMGPWLFWSSLYIIIDIVVPLVKSGHYPYVFNFHHIYNNIKGMYLYGNYWFIINFMVACYI